MAMTLNDYRTAVKLDIKDWLDENNKWPTAKKGTDAFEEQYDKIYDELFESNSVTGRASGCYTVSSAQSAENVSQLIWSKDLWDLLGDAFSRNAKGVLIKGPEYIDVSIRCVLLAECLKEVIKKGKSKTIKKTKSKK